VLSQSSNSPAPEGEPSPLADPARWAQLIEEVRPDACLVVIASSMSKNLRSHCAPEDIWQETLTRAWYAREAYRWQGSVAFRAWLFEIARNCIRDTVRRIDAAKRGGGQPAQRISDLGSQSSSSASGMQPPDSVTPSRILMHAERAAAMQRALATLPPELESVVRMHVLEELTMEVIAERLGIGVAAAWRRFRKGTALYSKQMSDWSGGSISGC